MKSQSTINLFTSLSKKKKNYLKRSEESFEPALEEYENTHATTSPKGTNCILLLLNV